MPRRLRRDFPGALHHVMNRGIARRTLFETRRDVRLFLALLARRVRAGDLEVLAYSVLTTHFHLLVRSPRGLLSAAMQRVLDSYARWFNRGRGRDGPLFRGRFVNRLVASEAHLGSVLRYIDDNAVEARLAATATAYPHGSAWHYARPAGPRWLERRTVEGLLGTGPGERWDPAAYERFAGTRPGQGERWVVERRLVATGAAGGEPLADLLDAAPGRVRDWMERRALLADGTGPGIPVVPPSPLAAAVAARMGRFPARVVVVGRRRAPASELLTAGLLREAAGLRLEEIADRMGIAFGTARNRVNLFRAALREDGGLLDAAAGVLEQVVAEIYGEDRGRLGGQKPALGQDIRGSAPRQDRGGGLVPDRSGREV